MIINKYKVRQNPGWAGDDQVLAWSVVWAAWLGVSDSFSGSAGAQWKQCSALSSPCHKLLSTCQKNFFAWGFFKQREQSQHKSRPGRMLSTARVGLELCPALGTQLGWAAEGNFGVFWCPTEGGPRVSALMGVVVSVLQLTAGTGQTGNQLSTMDTPWLPKSSSKMWLKLSTNMPLSRMSTYPACQPLSLSAVNGSVPWLPWTGSENLTCPRIPDRIWSCFLGENPSDPSERNTKAKLSRDILHRGVELALLNLSHTWGTTGFARECF